MVPLCRTLIASIESVERSFSMWETDATIPTSAGPMSAKIIRRDGLLYSAATAPAKPHSIVAWLRRSTEYFPLTEELSGQVY
jgi:hypothetical protein